MLKSASCHFTLPRWLRLAILPCAATLGACAAPHLEGYRVAVVPSGPVTVKGNADPNKAIPVLVCDASKTLCELPVTRTSSVPVLTPQLNTYECDVGVPELVVTRFSLKTLRWKLPGNQPGAVARFRFREATKQNPLEGISAYARTARTVFTPTRISDTEFDFVAVEPSPVRQAEGFAYGVYLEWLPAGQNQWLTCTPLDPIIIAMP